MTIIDICTVYEENKNIKNRLVQMESKLDKIESMVKEINSNLINLSINNLVNSTVTPFEISDHTCEQIYKKSNEDVIEDAIEKTIEARRKGNITKNTKTIEELQIQRMALQLEELKILLNNAKDPVTGKISLDNALNEHVRHILKSLIQNDEFLIGGCLILHKALGIKTTIKILIDQGDYNDEYSSILDLYLLQNN